VSAYDDQWERKLELIFRSAPVLEDDGPRVVSAYIALGSCSHDERDRPMLTSLATTCDELKAQIDKIKATLDVILGEAKARFAAADFS